MSKLPAAVVEGEVGKIGCRLLSFLLTCKKESEGRREECGCRKASQRCACWFAFCEMKARGGGSAFGSPIDRLV